MTFGESVLDFYRSLEAPTGLPDGVEVLFPFHNPEAWKCMKQFFAKYYHDHKPRILLMGINPGRFGAGITGIGFTDPIRLENDCNIKNTFEKRAELSSKFIYEVVHAFGGPEKFYSKFFISAVSPLGFVKNGKNYNYYDDPELEKAVRPFTSTCMEKKARFGCSVNIAFSIGQGKNIKFLEKLNSGNRFFRQIKALPHPRWVMQYRLKKKDEFIRNYVLELNNSTVS